MPHVGGATAPADELSSGAPRWRERWAALPAPAQQRARTAAVGAAALLVLLAGVGAREVVVARDLVALSASLEVTASSSGPDGGRVEHLLVVRNTTSRAVRVEAGQLDGPGLRGGPRGELPARLGAGQQVALPLTLVLDCPARSAQPDRPVRLSMTAVPPSARRQRVTPPVLQPEPLLAQIATLCAARPDLAGVELSGPAGRLGPAG